MYDIYIYMYKYVYSLSTLDSHAYTCNPTVSRWICNDINCLERHHSVIACKSQARARGY